MSKTGVFATSIAYNSPCFQQDYILKNRNNYKLHVEHDETDALISLVNPSIAFLFKKTVFTGFNIPTGPHSR